jgi:hypothetical protein
MKYYLLKKHRLPLVIAVVAAIAGIVGFVAFSSSFEPEDYKNLVGQWVRASGGYVLDIRDVQSDGDLELAYLNPRPINVSQAQANTEAGRINLFVELRDRHYPGNYYTLAYDSQNDRLVGVYHHLGIGQNMDVLFSRKPASS